MSHVCSSKNCPQNVFEPDMDLVNWWSSRRKGSVHKSRKKKIDQSNEKTLQKKMELGKHTIFLGEGGSARSTKFSLWVLVYFPRSTTPLFWSPLSTSWTQFTSGTGLPWDVLNTASRNGHVHKPYIGQVYYPKFLKLRLTGLGSDAGFELIHGLACNFT